MKKALVLACLLIFAISGLSVAPTADAVGFGKNVEWVTTVPLNSDSAGARRLGDWFYLTTSTALMIYDIKDPLNPKLTGVLPFQQTPQFAQEDVDTNGKILLIDDSVIDVTDKANPKVISTHGRSSHTITCVLDCTWAYASNGVIVDLRDPAHPVTSTHRWTTGTPVTNSHDVTEIKPGIIVTSTDPVLLLDARDDPEHPVLIGQGPRQNKFTHGNLWPHQGTDKFLLVGGEVGNTVPSDCNKPAAKFWTFDATNGWPTYDENGRMIKQGEFTKIAEWGLSSGSPTDGEFPPVAQWCAHWFDTHPAYRDGGLVAMAYYEHGVRILNVKADGQIEELGWYVPAGGMTSGVYWITDRIMYATDYQRSFDIFQYTGPIPSSG
ncbi:MAG: LVIVD repeat-containing protein [Actinomycetota bacterium]